MFTIKIVKIYQYKCLHIKMIENYVAICMFSSKYPFYCVLITKTKILMTRTNKLNLLSLA